jgi:hypothetical protein
MKKIDILVEHTLSNRPFNLQKTHRGYTGGYKYDIK